MVCLRAAAQQLPSAAATESERHWGKNSVYNSHNFIKLSELRVYYDQSRVGDFFGNSGKIIQSF